jgi:dienelactone hydrolase
MIRRKFLEYSSKTLLSLGLGPRLSLIADVTGRSVEQNAASSTPAERVLPGTVPLTQQGDLAEQMEDGIQQFLLRRIQEMPQERARLWQRDYRSAQDYEKSVSSHRKRLREIIGVVDPRVFPSAPELLASPLGSSELAQGYGYSVFAVRWSVFDPVDLGLSGLHAEGLLLQPEGRELARVVAIPDADWTPEMLVGLATGVPASAQFARRLAENGCQVLVPLLIDRSDTFSGNPEIKMTNQPHREWIYRMAFQMGRHIIGYEVQKVLAAIDWFASENETRRVPIGVMGYGEGGLIALYSATLDLRIDATVVSGYFQEREDVWKEPIYRDVWGLVCEFGDAEVASLIAPRVLIIEASRAPEADGPPPATREHQNVACPNGRLVSPPIDSVQREVDRTRPIFAALGVGKNLHLVINEDGHGLPGSEETLKVLLRSLGMRGPMRPLGEFPQVVRPGVDPQLRLQSQFDQMVAFTQGLAQKSPERRAEFWSTADTSSPKRWRETTKPQRDYIWEEVFGRLPAPSLPLNPRTRLIYDEPRFRGYEVMLDVWPQVFAYGILLLPKNLRSGERRPVVVCQHGLEGRPQEVTDPKIDSQFYHHFGASLADLGFVVYAPQNPCVGQEHFRIIQRMAHPLKTSINSFILGQNQQTLNWLVEQPFVDPERIGFYGMSYGGKAAIRVPPLLDRYALSICSGDFNDAVWSMTSVTSKSSFMFDDSYDVYEFNFANVIDYAELANLMAPRPFMVERGHSDGSTVDERVAFEYAKVARFYDQLGIADRTAIEYFDGAHMIHGKGTFDFLCKHLHQRGIALQITLIFISLGVLFWPNSLLFAG